MKQSNKMEEKTTENQRTGTREISREIRKQKRQQNMELIKEIIKDSRSLKVLRRNAMGGKETLKIKDILQHEITQNSDPT